MRVLPFFSWLIIRWAPRVFLTVSALAYAPIFKAVEIRKVVIDYYDADCDRMLRSYPFVGLYDHDPRRDPKHPLFIFKPTECPTGTVTTNYSFPYLEFATNDLSPKCLMFWAAYVEAGNVVHSNCLQTHPTWMSDIRKEIGRMTMNCLMIPGTHNSGLYLKYDRFKDTIYEKYMFTQDESVFNQLVYGIRFLDIRVWHEGTKLWKSKIQITHGDFHVGLPYLESVLDDVKKFVTGTEEFVVIDFHRLLSGYFMKKTLLQWQHRDIIELVKKTFGTLIIDSEYAEAQLETLWNMNKRVLITYRDELDWPEENYVTYPVYHWWNGAENVKDLHKYLVENACSYPYYSTAAVAVLTPTLWTPLIDATYSRRKTADQVNSLLNKWFRNELSCSNVVLTDYFLGNNVIEIAIEVNRNSRRCNFFWPTSDLRYQLASEESLIDD